MKCHIGVIEFHYCNQSFVPRQVCSVLWWQGDPSSLPAPWISVATDGHPAAEPSPFPSESSAGWPAPLRHLSCRDGNREPGFPQPAEDKQDPESARAFSCCHLPSQWTPAASPGVNRCPGSGDHGLVSRGMGMTFWQGDKRHFFLSLTHWPGT